MVSGNDRPVAGVLTLAYKDTLVCKYGCSDKEFSELGGTPLLFWKAIQDAKNGGLATLIPGDSIRTTRGLIVFTDRWGASRSDSISEEYRDRGARRARFQRQGAEWKNRIARRALPLLPDVALRSTGTFFTGTGARAH